MGLRFRKNARELPGKPDVVFPTEKIAVFCDGDFWHGRNWEEREARLKKGANAPYWLAKIRANMERDLQKTEALTGLGWEVLRLWETDILADPEREARKVIKLIIARRKQNASARSVSKRSASGKPT